MTGVSKIEQVILLKKQSIVFLNELDQTIKAEAAQYTIRRYKDELYELIKMPENKLLKLGSRKEIDTWLDRRKLTAYIWDKNK
jgi:hypothetical protein